VGKLKTTGGTSTYETSLYTRDGSNIGLYNKIILGSWFTVFRKKKHL